MDISHRDNRSRTAHRCLALAVLSMFPASALAYIGPGAGLSVIGSVLAFFAAIVVAIFGFLFFPIRRMLRKRKQRKHPPVGARIAGDRPRTPAPETPETPDTPDAPDTPTPPDKK